MKHEDKSQRGRLGDWAVPPPDPSRKEAALRAALAALAGPRPAAIIAPPRFRVRTLLQYAAAAVIGAGLTWWFIPRHPGTAPPQATVAAVPDISLQTLREIGQLFPGQLDAIIAGPEGVELRLAKAGAADLTDQAVRVTLSSSHERRTIITYSGRSVTLDFGGSPLCITPLINDDGAVIVLTEDRVFLPAVAASGEGLRVFATTLAQR